MRTPPILGLVLLLAACSSASTVPEPQAATSAAAAQSRSWQSDRSGRQVLTVTVFDDGTALLSRYGPPKMVPHWGELEIPDETEFATVRQVGGRTFLLVTGENPRLLEIAERADDRLAIWCYSRNRDDSPYSDARLLALPGAAQPPDAILAVIPGPKLRQPPAEAPSPVTRFAI
jgi:hypothetical protein